MKRLTYRTRAEINVTPMVDVFLILMVIFLMIAPLAARSLNVSVPDISAGGSPLIQNTLRLDLSSDGALRMGNRTITVTELPKLIKPNSTVELAADEKLSYARVAEVLGHIEQASPAGINLVIQ
jgi:biopolymer transport protein ExbD